MKIEDLEVGESYTRHDDGEYLVCYKSEDWALVLAFSHNHKVAAPRFITQKDLDADWNKDLHKDEDWNLADYLDCLKYADEYSLSFSY